MNMIKKIALSLITAAALVTAPVASVADDHIKDWEGFYAGVWGGFRSTTNTNTACATVCPTGFGAQGFFAGLTGGYDMHLENDVVIGAFAMVPLIAPSSSVTTANGTFTSTPQFAFMVGGRVGYAMDDILPYVFAGGGVGRVTTTPSAGGLTASSATHGGGFVGAGVEFAIHENVSLDAKYMFAYFGPGSYDFCGGVCTQSYSETSHNVSFGVNWRFN